MPSFILIHAIITILRWEGERNPRSRFDLSTCTFVATLGVLGMDRRLELGMITKR